MTPGPTPVPPAVLAAMSLPIVHHRTPGFRAMFGKLLASLQEIYSTSRRRPPLHGVGHRGNGLRRLEHLLSRATASSSSRPEISASAGFRSRRPTVATSRAPLPVGGDSEPRRRRGQARGDRRCPGGLPDPLGDLDGRRHRPAGDGGADQAVRRAGRGRCDLEPRRRSVRDRCVGPRRRRLGLPEGTDDPARAGARLRFRRRARSLDRCDVAAVLLRLGGDPRVAARAPFR